MCVGAKGRKAELVLTICLYIILSHNNILLQVAIRSMRFAINNLKKHLFWHILLHGAEHCKEKDWQEYLWAQAI